MRKIRVLYDASIVTDVLVNNNNRSGLCLTAFNILNELIRRKDVETYVYCSKPERNDEAKKMMRIYFPQYLDRFTYMDKYENLLYNIGIHSDNASERGNYFVSLLWKFIGAIVREIPKTNAEIKYNQEKLWDGFDAHFSPLLPVDNYLDDKHCLRKYVLLHDCMPYVLPEYFPNIDSVPWFPILVDSLNNRDRYFSNSVCTKKDFMRYNSVVSSEQITVSPLACSDSFKPVFDNIDIIKEKYKIPKGKKYVFSLCTLEPRKNLLRAVKTFVEFIKKYNIKDIIYVLGGGSWEKFEELLVKELENNSYKDSVIKIGYVDDKDLPYLYSSAEWFIYTSQYEGFGLPPLEAMSCGCPVITSNNSAIPEVVGDGNAITINWNSDEEHVRAYEKLYFDKNLRTELSKRGLERAKEFSWEKTVDIIVEEIKKDVEINGYM